MRTVKRWRIVASHILLDHPRLTVVEDEVVLASGARSRWLRFAGEADSVCVICVDNDRRVLIARQYSHPSGRVVQEFPGGGVQENESCADAARRELMEEVGLFPQGLREIGAFLTSNRRSSARQHVFVATDLTEQRLPHDPEEEIVYEWVDIPTVDERIRSGTIENGTLLAAWSIFRSGDRRER